MLQKRKSFSAHDKKLQILDTEIHNSIKGGSNNGKSGVFKQKNEGHHNLKYNSQFITPLVNRVYY